MEELLKLMENLGLEDEQLAFELAKERAKSSWTQEREDEKLHEYILTNPLNQFIDI